MFKTKQKLTPTIFSQLFQHVNHKYSTNYSNENYVIPKQSRKISKYPNTKYQ